MSDYRDRVRQERADLDEKLTKLERFLATVERPDSLLRSQADVMRAYIRILDARIEQLPEGKVLTSADLIADGKRGAQVGVEVTVTAPPGVRAGVELVYPHGSDRRTVTGGQSQTFSLADVDKLSVIEGKPHSNVGQMFSPDY